MHLMPLVIMGRIFRVIGHRFSYAGPTHREKVVTAVTTLF
jgi:hypothetical protein